MPTNAGDEPIQVFCESCCGGWRGAAVEASILGLVRVHLGHQRVCTGDVPDDRTIDGAPLPLRMIQATTEPVAQVHTATFPLRFGPNDDSYPGDVSVA
jgi:hypothetical protein